MPPHAAQSDETRLAILEMKQERTDDTLAKVTDVLERLTRLDMQNENFAARLAAMDAAYQQTFKEVFERLKAIEREMPTVALARDGVMSIAKRIVTTAVTHSITAGIVLYGAFHLLAH